MKKKIISPSESEIEVVAKKALAAAFKELSVLGEYDSSSPKDSGTIVYEGLVLTKISAQVLSAIRAIESVVEYEDKKFKETNEGQQISGFWINQHSILCTAIAARLHGSEDTFEWAPESVAGDEMRMLFQVFIGLELATCMWLAFDVDHDGPGGLAVEGISRWAKKSI